MADVGIEIMRGYACGSFTIPTGFFFIFVDNFSLAGTETITVEGTGILKVI